MFQHENNRDFLTGVYSRAAFQLRLQEEATRAARSKSTFSILLLDIDHFKSINDSYGHARGDQILIEFALRLQNSLRESDLVFRFGGDEFLVLLPNCSSTDARTLAERFADTIHSPPFPGTPPLTITACIGIANFPNDSDDADHLFEIADIRMLDGKRKGRGLIVDSQPDSSLDLSFDTLTRPFDREYEIQVTNRFCEDVAESSRGILIVTGEIGSGRSRFLREVEASAHIHGMEIIWMASSLIPPKKQFHLLNKSKRDIRLNFRGCKTTQDYVSIIQKSILDNRIQRLMFILDDLDRADHGSISVLSAMLLSSAPCAIAVCVSLPIGIDLGHYPLSAPVREIIRLTPISRDSLKIWLRNLIRWEATDEVINRLYIETGGFPGNIRKAITFLIKRGTLHKDHENWIMEDSFFAIKLADRLGFEPHRQSITLPALLTPFVGREDEVQKLSRLIGSKRLITIAGPGGTGKTRLALKVASDVATQFRHGCHFIALAAIASHEFIVSTIADTIRFTFYGRQDPKTELIDYLREKQILLILDNCEHLTEGGCIIAEILEQCQSLHIIATSQHRLRIRGETVLELRGMPYPTDLDRFDDEPFSAVRLFVQNALFADFNFKPTDEDRAQIIRICHLVEGIPLAIELASAWVRVLSCGMIADEIEKNLDFLESCESDVPARQRSLRAVFEHAWKLLPPNVRQSYSRLAIFRGGFSVGAAMSIASVTPLELAALKDCSFVYTTSSDRHYILEVLRQYAIEKLRKSSDDYTKTRTRFMNFYAELLEKYTSGPQTESKSFSELAVDIENIREGWEMAVEFRDELLLERYFNELSVFYDRTGLFDEAETLFRRAIQLLTEDDSPHSGMTKNMKILIGRMHNLHGSFLFGLSRYDQSKEAFTKGMVILRDLQNFQELAASLNGLGGVAARAGNYLQAKDIYEKSLELRRRLNDKRGIASSLNNLANVQGALGETVGSLKLYEESLDIVRELGERKAMAMLMANVGITAGMLGDTSREQKLLKESYVIRKEIGDRAGIAISLDNLGNIEFNKGNSEKARSMLQESLDIRREIGDRWAIANSLMNLANVLKSPEDAPDRLAYISEALDIFREIGDRCGVAMAMSQLGGVLCAMDQTDRSVELLTEALEIFKTVGDSNGMILNRILMAMTEHKRGNRGEARRLLKTAIRDAVSIRAVQLGMRAMLDLGRMDASGSRSDREFSVGVLSFLGKNASAPKKLRESALDCLKELESHVATDVFFLAQQEGEHSTIEKMTARIVERK